MRTILWAGIGLAVLGLSHARADDDPRESSRERIELTKRIYRDKILSGLQKRTAPPHSTSGPTEEPLLNEAMAEDLHRWSVRWMEAECDAATDRAARVAAAQAHVERMRSVEMGTMARKELSNHPLVKDLDARKIHVVDFHVEDLRKVQDAQAETTRRYPEVARYFRLEAEARLARERAGR